MMGTASVLIASNLEKKKSDHKVLLETEDQTKWYRRGRIRGTRQPTVFALNRSNRLTYSPSISQSKELYLSRSPSKVGKPLPRMNRQLHLGLDPAHPEPYCQSYR